MADNKDKKILNVPALRFPEFSGEWNTSSIEEQFELYSGNTPSRMDKKQFDGTVNWITSGELKEHYIADTKEKISDEAVKSNNLKLLPVGTFVIAIYGLEADGVRGTCSITASESTISQACMAFISKKDIANEFLYAWYKKHGNVIGIRYAQGTKQQNLSYDIIEKFNISYPCIEEQKKLIRFISLIDERIATQNKIIEKLETLIKGIVELAFSHAATSNTLGCYITQISQRNKTGKDLPVLSVSNKHGFVEQSEQFEDRIIASDDTSNYKIVDINDFAYNPARINVGSIARLKDKECGIVSPMYICFRTSKDILPEYLELFFKTVTFSFEVGKRLEGSVRLCLSYESLCEIVIPIISIREQQSLVKMVTTFHSKLDVEKGFLSSYQSQKQCLLSQMFI